MEQCIIYCKVYIILQSVYYIVKCILLYYKVYIMINNKTQHNPNLCCSFIMVKKDCHWLKTTRPAAQLTLKMSATLMLGMSGTVNKVNS